MVFYHDGGCLSAKLGCKRCDRGVLLKIKGAHVAASLCECVRRCHLCTGSGRVFSTDARGREYADPCLCQQARKRVLLVQSADLPARYSDAQFVDAQKDRQNAEAFSTLQLMAKDYCPGVRGVVLMGAPGVGKTWLAVSFLRELIDRHQVKVLFRDFSHLLADLRSGYNQGRAEQEFLNPLVEVDVLLIDELGKGRNTQWEQTILDTIVTLRYNARRCCVFTSNYNLTSHATLVEHHRSKEGPDADVEVRDTLVQRVGERIFSRLKETCEFVTVGGEDRRKMAHIPHAF